MFLDPQYTALEAQQFNNYNLFTFLLLSPFFSYVTSRLKTFRTVAHVFSVYIQAIPINRNHGYTPENITRK
jgi:hypothetical protein